MARVAIAITLLCSGLGASPCAEAQADEHTPPAAVEAYRQARELYEAGQYPEAAVALEHALHLDPDSPTLVYNLARVYELLGELDRAVALYERYQTMLPDQQAREQERAEATLRRLRGARDSQARAAPTPPPREVEPLRQLPGVVLVREHGVADAAFFITLIVGGTSLAAGAVFGGLALDARSNAESFVLTPDRNIADRNELAQRAQAFGAVADVTLSLGGIAVLAAGMLYFLREHTVERAPVSAGDVEATLDASPSGLSVGLTGWL